MRAIGDLAMTTRLARWFTCRLAIERIQDGRAIRTGTIHLRPEHEAVGDQGRLAREQFRQAHRMSIFPFLEHIVFRNLTARRQAATQLRRGLDLPAQRNLRFQQNVAGTAVLGAFVGEAYPVQRLRWSAMFPSDIAEILLHAHTCALQRNRQVSHAAALHSRSSVGHPHLGYWPILLAFNKLLAAQDLRSVRFVDPAISYSAKYAAKPDAAPASTEEGCND